MAESPYHHLRTALGNHRVAQDRIAEHSRLLADQREMERAGRINEPEPGEDDGGKAHTDHREAP